MSNPCLLLTGASGFVGSALLPLLLKNRPDRQVVLLSRSHRSASFKSPAVSIVKGDLTERGLGLSSETRDALVESVTEIIHCAADIRFRIPLSEARATNFAGTRRLLALAKQCKRLERFAHISTVYIAGAYSGTLPEARFWNNAGFLNAYQRSKYEAEHLVFDAMREIPASIFRLSTIISDSNGAVRQLNYFHQVLRLAPRNLLPIIPGDSDAPLDLIAIDWAASALASLYDYQFTPNRVYQVCAGPEASMSVGEILGSTFQILNESRRAREHVAPPKLVGLEEFKHFAQHEARHGNAAVKQLLEVVGTFLPQLAIPQRYENRETLALLERTGLIMPSLRQYYPKVVASCLGGRLHEA